MAKAGSSRGLGAVALASPPFPMVACGEMNEGCRRRSDPRVWKKQGHATSHFLQEIFSFQNRKKLTTFEEEVPVENGYIC